MPFTIKIPGGETITLNRKEITMEKVRAKFKCDQVTQYDGGAGEVKLSAVTSGSEENKQFWKYTPAGDLKMHIDNPAALETFEPGQEYYLDIQKA